MKILIFGKNGQVARRLYPALLPLGELIVYGSDEVDLRDFDKIREAIRRNKPDVIINAAGYTDVDGAESANDDVFAINAEAVKIMAEESIAINAWLIHYSTDYVFDGTKTEPYTEEDLPNPINIYGKSKLQGDNYIQSIAQKYIILRTSWIYDSYGKNFPKTILALAQKNEVLKVVKDQVGAPTNACLVASVTSFILYRIITISKIIAEGNYNRQDDFLNISGIYNLSSSGQVSRYDFAQALIKCVHDAGGKVLCPSNRIIEVLSSDYKTIANRPANSVLDTEKISNIFGLIMPKWGLYIPPLLTGLKAMNLL